MNFIDPDDDTVIIATASVTISVDKTQEISKWKTQERDSKWMPETNHPLARYMRMTMRTCVTLCELLCETGDTVWRCRHNGGRSAKADMHTFRSMFSCLKYCRERSNQTQWVPARAIALQNYEGMTQYDQSAWLVPGKFGAAEMIDDQEAPPVAKVTCCYGVNIDTPRSIFVKHRKVFVSDSGEGLKEMQSPFVLDTIGNVDGLKTIDGVAFETAQSVQFRPDDDNSGKLEKVWVSGDGTVAI